MHSDPTDRARCSNVIPAGADNPINLKSANKCSYLELNCPLNSYTLIIAMTPVNLLIHISLVHLAEAQTNVSSFVYDCAINTFTRTNTLLYSQCKSVKESHVGTHAHTQSIVSR
jgi:hypothetical protein